MATPAEQKAYLEAENKRFQEEFDSILDKDVNDLTEHDKQFLVGRRHLLNGDHQDKFGAVINETLARNTGSTSAPAKKPKAKAADDSEE